MNFRVEWKFSSFFLVRKVPFTFFSSTYRVFFDRSFYLSIPYCPIIWDRISAFRTLSLSSPSNKSKIAFRFRNNKKAWFICWYRTFTHWDWALNGIFVRFLKSMLLIGFFWRFWWVDTQKLANSNELPFLSKKKSWNFHKSRNKIHHKLSTEQSAQISPKRKTWLANGEDLLPNNWMVYNATAQILTQIILLAYFFFLCFLQSNVPFTYLYISISFISFVRLTLFAVNYLFLLYVLFFVPYFSTYIFPFYSHLLFVLFAYFFMFSSVWHFSTHTHKLICFQFKLLL